MSSRPCHRSLKSGSVARSMRRMSNQRSGRLAVVLNNRGGSDAVPAHKVRVDAFRRVVIADDVLQRALEGEVLAIEAGAGAVEQVPGAGAAQDHVIGAGADEVARRRERSSARRRPARRWLMRPDRERRETMRRVHGPRLTTRTQPLTSSAGCLFTLSS